MARYRFAIWVIVLAGVLGAHPNTLLAQSLKTPDFQEGATKGFDYVYNLDYEEARAAFENLRHQYPRHPGPPLYLALTLWHRELFRRQDLGLDRLASPESFMQATGQQMPPQDRAAFLAYIGESQTYSRAILKEKPGDRDARYFLGAAHAALAGFALTIDHDKRETFRQGRQAYLFMANSC